MTAKRIAFSMTEASVQVPPSAAAPSLRGIVVFAVPDFDPLVGGTTRQAGLQARALVARGYDVVVVTRRRRREWPRREDVDGLRVWRLGLPGRGRAAEKLAVAGLSIWLRRRRKEIAVLQLVMWPDAVLAAAAAGLELRTVMLWAIRGEIEHTLRPGSSSGRRLQASMRRSLLRRTAHVVLTPRMASEMAASGLSRDPVIIPVPVDRGRFRPPPPGERERARARLRLRPSAFTIVYVGHLEERKGLDRLVAAVAILVAERRDVRLLLVGGTRGTPEDTDRRLRRQVERLALDDVVTFCGIATDPTPYLWAADAFVLPSVREGMPNSIIEAMACKLASVAPPSAGGDELLDDGETGLVPPTNDPHHLAAALRQLADDPEQRAALARAAESRAGAFDIERVIEDYERLYHALAAATER
jgi:L-malate glycosyltransferase